MVIEKWLNSARWLMRYNWHYGIIHIIQDSCQEEANRYELTLSEIYQGSDNKKRSKKRFVGASARQPHVCFFILHVLSEHQAPANAHRFSDSHGRFVRHYQ